MINKTVCELFAGVGGFRLGLEKASADWQTVWANQWEPGKKVQHAFECYESHFGHSENHINDDISKINKLSVPNHNLLVGGFPCQDYSVARTGAKGITGVKGVLWWQIRDILESKSPRFVLLENVDRLLKSPTNQRGRDFSVILKCFDDLGYNVEWRVINAAEYGFPQRRRRVFIFASKDNSNFSKECSLFSAESVISKKGFFAQTFPISYFEKIKETDLRILPDIYDISESFSFLYQNSGLMHKGKVFTCHTKPMDNEPNILLNLVETDVDSKYYLNGSLDKWSYLKGPKRINRKSKNGFEYTFSEGGMSFPDSLNKPARTMLTSESSINRSTHVINDPQTNKLRLITPLEAERINGFDDQWTDTGMPEKFRYFCMGNALVVGLVEKMGRTLNSIFINENP